MSDEIDWDFSGPDDAKAEIRAAVGYLLKDAAGSDCGDIESWTNPLRGRGGCVERGVFPLEASPCLGPRHTRTATYSTAFQKRLPLARWCCCPRAASLLSRSSL